MALENLNDIYQFEVVIYPTMEYDKLPIGPRKQFVSGKMSISHTLLWTPKPLLNYDIDLIVSRKIEKIENDICILHGVYVFGVYILGIDGNGDYDRSLTASVDLIEIKNDDLYRELISLNRELWAAQQ